MRCLGFTLVFAVLAGAQGQPHCSGIALDVDARCACIKDPRSQVCELVKKGFYDSKGIKPINPGWLTGYRPSTGTGQGVASIRSQPRPQQARVVSLPSKEYLRFLHPNARFAAGFDFERIFRSPEVMQVLLGVPGGADDRNKLLPALMEIDHLWLSFSGNADGVLLMTGKFEQGATAGLFYSQGVMPMFLGGAHVMMVGPEPSLQAALARLAKPVGANDGWVARRARALSQDHEGWIVTEPPAVNDHEAKHGVARQLIRRFALGFRLNSDIGLDGEAVADSQAGAQEIAAWVDQIKSVIRVKTGVGALDSLKVTVDGTTLRFAAADRELLSGESGKKAMSSDFGVELHGLIGAALPGMAAGTVAEDKLLTVTVGMKREEVLNLLGAPLSVTSIQGLDTPRETWTYQVPFGKSYSVRLESGVVSQPPR